MKAIKDIIEILELVKEELENNDENTSAILDLQDLKALKNLYDLYKETEKERDDIYNDYQDLGKENLKLQEELEREKEKNKDLEEKLKIAVAMLTKGTYPEENEGDNDFDKQFISKNKIMELLENEIIDISGFRCIAVEDIEELFEEKQYFENKAEESE